MPTSMTDRAGLDPVAADHLGPADGGDDDVRAARDRRQVVRARMRDGHGAVRLQQQLRHRLADDVGAPDHDRLAAGKAAERRAQQQQAAQRRAGHEAVRADREPAHVGHVEAVDVLVGSIASMTAASTMPAGSGGGPRIPCTAGSTLSAWISVSSSASVVSADKLCWIE